jgi:hypothetical protein
MDIDSSIWAVLLKRAKVISALGRLSFVASLAILFWSFALALPILAISLVIILRSFWVARAISGRYILRHFANHPIPNTDNPGMKLALLLLMKGNDSLSLLKDATADSITANAMEIPKTMLSDVLVWVGYFMTHDAEYAKWTKDFRDSFGVKVETQSESVRSE